MRRFSVWQVLWYAFSLLLLYLIVSQFGEIRQILDVLGRGNGWLILLAVLLQIGFFLNGAAAIQSLYTITGTQGSLRNLLSVILASTFASLVAPTGTWGGVTFFVHAQRQRGIRSGVTLFVNVLYLLLDYLVVALILVVGLTSLALRQDISRLQIVAAALMGALLFALILFIFLIVEAPALPLTLIQGMLFFANKVARLFKRSIDIPRTLRSIEVFRGNFSRVMRERNLLTRPFLHVVVNHLLYLSTLSLLFTAFGVALELPVLISSYALILLFTIISLTPSGLGFVETIGTLALSTQKVPVNAAVVIVLTYRLLTFWLPLIVGYFAMRNLRLSLANEVAKDPPET